MRSVAAAVVRDVDGLGGDVTVHLPDCGEFGVPEHRRVEHELAGVVGRLVEEVALEAEPGLQAEHESLADVVDRRVRHLGEQLFEIREQRPVEIGEDRQRRVVTHRSDGVFSAGRHRLDEIFELVVGVAVGSLPAAEVLDAVLRER
jgi:hypothetical protein